MCLFICLAAAGLLLAYQMRYASDERGCSLLCCAVVVVVVGCFTFTSHFVVFHNLISGK